MADHVIPTNELTAPLTLHLDQHAVAALNRYRDARADHLKRGHDGTVEGCELYATYEDAGVRLAAAVHALVEDQVRGDI